MVRQIDENTVKQLGESCSYGSHPDHTIEREVFTINTALVVYTSRNSTYMEKINFRTNAEGHEIAVGTSAVRLKDILNIKKAIGTMELTSKSKTGDQMKTKNFEGMLPSNILYWNRIDYKRIIWTVDAQMLHVAIGSSKIDVTIPMDKIIFATNGTVIKGFLAPKRKDELDGFFYLDALPLPNFYGSSNMCNGSTELPNYFTMEGYLQAWEDRVFKTKYSNENLGMGGLKGLTELDGKKRLPKRFRTRTDVTIDKLIEWLT